MRQHRRYTITQINTQSGVFLILRFFSVIQHTTWYQDFPYKIAKLRKPPAIVLQSNFVLIEK